MSDVTTEVEEVDVELSDSGEEAETIRIDWPKELQVELSDSMLDSMQAYGSFVNTDRALPDIRDGLKPVQRRILYGMTQSPAARFGDKMQKSAKTVGKVMGDYHPHGDAAIYAAMVRMAQPFVMNVPLIQWQGNVGSVNGSPAAASRYTEARLSQITTEALAGDLNNEIVKYRPNYDQTREEPTVLPLSFPNLLVNGAKGIGWSMACEIPTHNLAEVIDAVLYLVDNPDASLKQLMKKLPAPDFPGGGIIVNPELLEECYRTGRGTIQVQAKYSIENAPGNQQKVVITELPYMVGPLTVHEQVAKAARDGKITEVTELPEVLGDKNALRLEVLCKRGGNVQALIAQLMKHTSCRQSVAFNMNVLIDRAPRVVALNEMLEHFLAFRLEVVTKRLEKERNDLERELLRLLALRSAVDVIDTVIKIVRTAQDDAVSRDQLMKALKWTPWGEKKPRPISEEQAQFIIDMQIKRINQLNSANLDADIQKRGERIDEITAILASENGVREIVREELREVKKQFGTPRKTAFGAETVIAASGEGRRDVAIVAGPVEPVTLYVSASGQALLTPQAKKRPASSPLKVADEALVSVLDTKTDQALYVFSERGICFRLSLADMPVEPRSSKGRSLVPLERGDKVVAVVPVGSASHFAFLTVEGALKRIEEGTIAASHPGGMRCIGLRGEDRVVAVLPHSEKSEALALSAQGKALRFDLSKLRVVQGAEAGGVAGMKLADGDRVVALCEPDSDHLLLVHEAGFGKRVKMEDYPQKGRGTGGVFTAAIDKPTRGGGPAGEIVTGIAIPSAGDVTLFSRRGQILTVELDKLAVETRANVSKPLFMELGPDDAVAGAVARYRAGD